MKIFSLIFLCFCSVLFGFMVKGSSFNNENTLETKNLNPETILCGADRAEEYLPLLEGKRVGLVVNHTSVIVSPEGNLVPLPDSLINLGVDVRCIFAPEHGYKGVAGAGEHVGNGTDNETGLKIYSLYGKTRKPQAEWLADLDVLIFDMQDVGARFYTYLSTMKYVIEACFENNKSLIVLDRPNPNDTIDGPVLKPGFTSFVGCIEIPLLHGCTLGELAKMMVGEGWITQETHYLLPITHYPKLTIIPCSGWKHGQKYDVPIAPSPNLPNPHAISLYPSLCLFEATEVSVGRGAEFPFEVYGHPYFKNQTFEFTPKPSASNKNPLQNGKVCKGEDLRNIEAAKGFSLEYLLKAYKQLGNKLITSNSTFDRLAGTDELRQQILAGKSEDEIRESWQKDLDKYKEIRNKYLIY